MEFQARADGVDMGRTSSALKVASAVANPVGTAKTALQNGINAIYNNPEKLNEGIEAGKKVGGKVLEVGQKVVQVGGQGIEMGKQAGSQAMNLKQKFEEKIQEKYPQLTKENIKSKWDEHVTDDRKQKAKEIAQKGFEATKKGISKGKEYAGLAYQKHQDGTLVQDVKSGVEDAKKSTFDWVKGGCCFSGERKKD
jgi:hypothetical protein